MAKSPLGVRAPKLHGSPGPSGPTRFPYQGAVGSVSHPQVPHTAIMWAPAMRFSSSIPHFFGGGWGGCQVVVGGLAAHA